MIQSAVGYQARKSKFCIAANSRSSYCRGLRGLVRLNGAPTSPWNCWFIQLGPDFLNFDDGVAVIQQKAISKGIRQKLPKPIDKYCIQLDYSSILGSYDN